MSEAKPYGIPKQLVWDAYRWVKANGGAAGVDGESLTMFEQDLKGNLYKIWNRMSSGTYFPPQVEPVFHPDSYGYRPGRSAHDALAMTRQRCWAADWVIDLDIKGFFDALRHDLVERALAHHTDNPWLRLYIARWLKWTRSFGPEARRRKL